MEKITIHRGLAELKLIGAKIQKGTIELVPSGIQQTGRLVNGLYEKVDFEKSVKEKFQSVTDLIERRNKIKSAIVQINGVTKVKIGEDEMTIADAINLKAVIAFKKELIAQLTRQHKSVKANVEKHNANVDASALKLAEAALQKQNVKIGDDDVQKVIAPYVEANKALIVDPIGVEKKVEEMEKKVSDFETEVDAVLSEINAVTFIEF